MLTVGICGASGYTGAELLRLLSAHPSVRITVVTSERLAGRPLVEHFPHLKGILEIDFRSIEDPSILKEAELFFLALPHGASQQRVAFFYEKGKYVIDLSADFRLKDPEVYKAWYKIEHTSAELLKHAVYGIPEIYRDSIRGTRLVANPGCYPTAALLGLYPAVKESIVDLEGIVIDAKSGVSGAGRKADVGLSFCEVNEAFRAYAVTTHRHTPEIEEVLSMLAGSEVKVEFTPHLLPVNRGILTTIYCKLKKPLGTEELLALYRDFYKEEPFVRVCDEGIMPDIKNVRGTNYCDIGLKVNTRTGGVIIITAIDNLVKGASGQAIQNMNVMMNFEETAGLKLVAPLP